MIPWRGSNNISKAVLLIQWAAKVWRCLLAVIVSHLNPSIDRINFWDPQIMWMLGNLIVVVEMIKMKWRLQPVVNSMSQYISHQCLMPHQGYKIELVVQFDLLLLISKKYRIDIIPNYSLVKKGWNSKWYAKKITPYYLAFGQTPDQVFGFQILHPPSLASHLTPSLWARGACLPVNIV